MTEKMVIKTIITLIFIIISFFIIVFIQMPEFKNAVDLKADLVVDLIKDEVKQGRLTENTLEALPNKFLFAVWVKKDDQAWLPLLYDKQIVTLAELTNPENIPEHIKFVTLPIQRKVKENFDYYLWVFSFNPELMIHHIILIILFLLFIYLVLLLLIEIFFKERYADDPVSEDEITKGFSRYQSSSKYNEDTPEQKDELIDEYKALWMKNFKISNSFKDQFPFKQIYDLIRFGIKPDQYIREGLAIATDFFGWQNAEIFIRQKNEFISSSTLKVLNPAEIKIPKTGNQRGNHFIPLFPYQVKEVYGFLYFTWNRDDKFYISDILYFLKYFFSDRAKPIFLNYQELEKIINILNEKLDSNQEVAVAILEADHKEQLLYELKEAWQENLDKEIQKKLILSFSHNFIFKMSTFCYCIISEGIEEIQLIQTLENWIAQKENQNYHVSAEYGQIALTFSCGIAFKRHRNLHPVSLINEAENALKNAIQNGRNQICY